MNILAQMGKLIGLEKRMITALKLISLRFRLNERKEMRGEAAMC